MQEGRSAKQGQRTCTRCSVDQSATRERNDAETAPPSAACFSLQMRADHKGKRTSAGTKHSPGREEDVRRPPYRAVLMSSKKEIVHQAHYRGSKRFVIPCGHMCASARHVRWADYGGGQHSHPTWRCRLPAVSWCHTLTTYRVLHHGDYKRAGLLGGGGVFPYTGASGFEVTDPNAVPVFNGIYDPNDPARAPRGKEKARKAAASKL